MKGIKVVGLFLSTCTNFNIYVNDLTFHRKKDYRSVGEQSRRFSRFLEIFYLGLLLTFLEINYLYFPSSKERKVGAFFSLKIYVILVA